MAFVSKDPKVLAFLKSLAPYDTVTGTPLTNSLRTCVVFAPGTPSNVIDALDEATTCCHSIPACESRRESAPS